jgi:serine/threonine-protein kinase
MVALKILAPDLANSENFRRRFLRESQLAASLDHPNIIPIYDAGETHGTLYIAMRYVEGSNLGALLARGRPIDFTYVLDVLSQVADALDAAHAHDLVHRNLKPANILISSATADDGHDHIYVTDFGVTRPVTHIAVMDPAGSVDGTGHYLAPEQIFGGAVSPRTDVYALGCIVQRCLSGSVPIAGRDDAADRSAPTEDPPPVSHQRPPAAVHHLVAKAMANNPADRYPDCRTFITALDDYLHPGGSVTRNQPSVSPAPQRPVGSAAPVSVRAPGGIRRRTALGILTGAVVVAVGLGAYHATSTQRFQATDIIPISLTYPSRWAEADGGTTIAFSPYAQDIRSLFDENNGEQNWPRIGAILRTDRVSFQGLLVLARPGDEGTRRPEQQQQLLRARLPASLDFVVGQPVKGTVGGVPANIHHAELNDPANPEVRLRLLCYLATVRTPEARTVWLIFISSTDRFAYNLPTFDRIVKSVVPLG